MHLDEDLSSLQEDQHHGMSMAGAETILPDLLHLLDRSKVAELPSETLGTRLDQIDALFQGRGPLSAEHRKILLAARGNILELAAQLMGADAQR